MEKSNKKIVIRLKIIYFLAKSTLLHITIISSINQYYKNNYFKLIIIDLLIFNHIKVK